MDRNSLLKDLMYEDGKLYWIKTNNQFSGVCGNDSIDSSGYKRMTYKNKHYLIHRIIFLLHHGYLPKYIDHIDGDSSNNKIENLRPCTQKQNSMNRRTRRELPKNVYQKCGSYFVALRLDNKLVRFGTYKDLELAELVATEARDKYHGEFARHV